jgi:hypothetical protein
LVSDLFQSLPPLNTVHHCASPSASPPAEPEGKPRGKASRRSQWAQPVGEWRSGDVCSTEKILTNRPLPLSEAIKAHKWAQPVNPLLTPLTVHVSPPAALEGEAAGEARGRSGRARLKARRKSDTAEEQGVRDGNYETASGN